MARTRTRFETEVKGATIEMVYFFYMYSDNKIFFFNPRVYIRRKRLVIKVSYEPTRE